MFLRTSKKLNIHLDFSQKSAYVSRQKAMRDLRNRIKEMISFIEIKYPTYALQVVSIIPDSDLENDRFHWYGRPKEFDYEKIQPDYSEILSVKIKS